MKRKIDRRNERLQRWDIITISKAGDADHLDEMIRLLQDSRTPYDNARHIVRALGKIPHEKTETELLRISRVANGLILGDVAEAFGRLRTTAAKPLLLTWTNHEISWVREKSSWALKRFAEARTSNRVPVTEG